MAKWGLEQQLQAVLNRKDKFRKKAQELKKKLQEEEDKKNVLIGRLVIKHYKTGTQLPHIFYSELEQILEVKTDKTTDNISNTELLDITDVE